MVPAGDADLLHQRLQQRLALTVAAVLERLGQLVAPGAQLGQFLAQRNDMQRVRALGAAWRNAELALHQAVHEARSRDRALRPTWRALAAAAAVPFQTFHRRYRGELARTRPGNPYVRTSDVPGPME